MSERTIAILSTLILLAFLIIKVIDFIQIHQLKKEVRELIVTINSKTTSV